MILGGSCTTWYIIWCDDDIRSYIKLGFLVNCFLYFFLLYCNIFFCNSLLRFSSRGVASDDHDQWKANRIYAKNNNIIHIWSCQIVIIKFRTYLNSHVYVISYSIRIYSTPFYVSESFILLSTYLKEEQNLILCGLASLESQEHSNIWNILKW